MPTLLLIEDDPDLRDLLTRLLTEEGYTVEACGDGQSGMHAALRRPPEVLVLDRGLPDGDGLELLTRLRKNGLRSPVLVLTAYTSLSDRVAGLDAGAEDYLGKPFDVPELLARLRALLRRSGELAVRLPIGKAEFLVDDLRVVLPDGDVVDLSRAQGSLLAALARRPGRVFTRYETPTSAPASSRPHCRPTPPTRRTGCGWWWSTSTDRAGPLRTPRPRCPHRRPWPTPVVATHNCERPTCRTARTASS